MMDYKQGLQDGADTLSVALLTHINKIEQGRKLCSERGYYSQTLTFDQIRTMVAVGFKDFQGVTSGTSRGSDEKTQTDR